MEEVRQSSKPGFRPSVQSISQDVDEEVIHMMQKCWSEDPLERPDFQALKRIVRVLNK